MGLTFFAIFSGLLAGMIHVYTGPDHLSAIAPLAAERRSTGWRVGLLWGLGHSGGVWILTLLVLLLGELVPVATLSGWSERLVGIVLIAVGAWGLHRAFRIPLTSTDAENHAHPHSHNRLRGAAAIGLVHGLAGSSHLVSVLPVLFVNSLAPRLGYALGFGFGSIIAMSVFGAIIGLVASRSAGFGPLAFRRLLSVCAVMAIAVGCWWLTVPAAA